MSIHDHRGYNVHCDNRRVGNEIYVTDRDGREMFTDETFNNTGEACGAIDLYIIKDETGLWLEQVPAHKAGAELPKCTVTKIKDWR